MKLAAAFLLLAVGAAAAKHKKAPVADAARPSGVVVKSSSKISPGADGPVFREGRLTLKLDRSEDEVVLKATAKTKVTLDGKAAKFSAALPGVIVLRAAYDSASKVLTALDLKSAPRAAEPPAEPTPGSVTGEVAVTDVIRGVLSVRVASQGTRNYAVTERTRIAGQSGVALGFDAIKIGDSVDVNSADGKTADEVLVRIAP